MPESLCPEKGACLLSQCAKLKKISMFTRWTQPLFTDEKTEAVGVSEWRMLVQGHDFQTQLWPIPCVLFFVVVVLFCFLFWFFFFSTPPWFLLIFVFFLIPDSVPNSWGFCANHLGQMKCHCPLSVLLTPTLPLLSSSGSPNIRASTSRWHTPPTTRGTSYSKGPHSVPEVSIDTKVWENSDF